MASWTSYNIGSSRTATKKLNEGKAIASTAIGSEDLYRYLHNNSAIEFHTSDLGFQYSFFIHNRSSTKGSGSEAVFYLMSSIFTLAGIRLGMYARALRFRMCPHFSTMTFCAFTLRYLRPCTRGVCKSVSRYSPS